MTACAASVYRRPVSPPEPCGKEATGERLMVDDDGARRLPACGRHLAMKREPFAWRPPREVAS